MITVKTRTYTEVPKLIIELNYQLNALPHVKEINDKMVVMVYEQK